MLRVITIGLVGICMLLLAGCANLRYESGNRTQYRIGPEKWIVYYEGTPDMRESLVLDYALNHCAEVTLMLGYKYYKVLGVQRGGSTSSHYIPGMETSVMSVDPASGPIVTSRVIEGRVITSSRDSYSVTIEVFREPTEGALDAQEVWDAFKVRENIGAPAAAAGGNAATAAEPVAGKE